MNGRFRKGHIPFNKNIPMQKWMDGRKIKKVMKYLEIGRGMGNPGLAGHNSKRVVAINGSKIVSFASACAAQRILRQRDIKISAKNINLVCNKKIVKNGKYNYTRKHAGGYQWFFADDKQLLDLYY